MQRRNFLGALGAAAADTALRAAAPAKLKIAAVEVWKLEGHRETQAGVNQQFQANPLHIYEELRPKPHHDSPAPTLRTVAATALYLKIKTDQGLEGLYGPIDREVAIVVLEQLRPFLLGKDALAGET